MAPHTTADDASAGSYPLRSNSRPAAQPAARKASARKMPKRWIGTGPTCRMSGIIGERGDDSGGVRSNQVGTRLPTRNRGGQRSTHQPLQSGQVGATRRAASARDIRSKEGVMWDRRLITAVRAALAVAFLAVAPARAHATQRFGPIQISGNLQTTNLVRHPDQETYQFVQNRNVAHVRLDYDWLQGGKFYDKYNIPFLESSHLFILWRGVYDSIYDTTPGFRPREDIHGRAYVPLGVPLGVVVQPPKNIFDFAQTPPKGCVGAVGCLEGGAGIPRRRLTLAGLSHGERDALKFDDQLREAYADIKLRTIPLSVRAGRQQIVWGETDNNRLLDRPNALDLTWHLQQEIPSPVFGWDEIRRPYWMLKFLYDLGNIGKFSQNFLDWYWHRGDWRAAEPAFLPRPWSLPFFDPLANPVDGAFTSALCSNAAKNRCTRLVNK